MKKILLSIFVLSVVNVGAIAQNWDQIIKTVSSDREAGDNYGVSVSISGDKAIVGALFEKHDVSGANQLTDAGSVYILELIGGTWTETAKLVASDRTNNDLFGTSVSISGDKAIVGAYFEDHDASGGNTLIQAGSAYVFELNGGTWAQTAKLVASDRGADDKFGLSVSISGDKAIVGAYQEDEDVSGANTLNNAGSAYVFELSGGIWTETAKLVASDRGVDDLFGYSVSISGDKAIIGALYEDEDATGANALNGAGSAYVFEFSGGVWAQTEKLVASDRGAGDSFGFSVSLSGDKAIVGALNEDEDVSGANALIDAGSAYIFELSGGTWSQTAKLVASDRGAGDSFGISVSISGDKAIVGARFEDEDASDANTLNEAGSAYVFELNGGTWAQTAKLVASDRGVEDRFGRGVSISGDIAIVGAFNDDEDVLGLDTLIDAGSVYFFETTLNVGLNKETLENVLVYPNPTSNYLIVSTQEELTVTLSDLNGRVLQSETIQKETSIDMSPYAKGGYFLVLTNTTGNVVRKIIKQ